MARGRQTKRLTKEQRSLLEEFRTTPHKGAPGGYSVAALHKAMRMPFSPETLGKALRGLPVWDLSHSWLVAWIERYLMPRKDGQAASEGDFGSSSGVKGSTSQTPDPGAAPAESPLEQEAKDEQRNEKGTGTTRTVRGSR